MGYANLAKQRGVRITKASVDGLPITVVLANKQASEPLGPIRRVVMHWTADRYTKCYDDYHFCIVYDKAKKKAHVVKTLQLTQKGMHAYHFNTGSLGVSFCAMVGATQEDYGECPVVGEMVEVGSQFVAELLALTGLDPRTVGKLPGLQAHLLDHFQIDRVIEKSGRWDIVPLWKDFVTRVQDKYDALKSGRLAYCYKGIILE